MDAPIDRKACSTVGASAALFVSRSAGYDLDQHEQSVRFAILHCEKRHSAMVN